jgi:hypothetical protein
MAGDVVAVPDDAFDFEVAYGQLATRMRSLHIARVAEMPRIELYLDQVLSLVSTELSFMCVTSDKLVTGSMVNNYVKQRIVPAPVRKRYTRRHLATLLFVCAFKRVLSIAQIGQLFMLSSQLNIDVERAYDAVVGLFERAIAGLFPEDPAGHPERHDGELVLVDSSGNRVPGELERLLENAVFLLAYTVYVDHMLALETHVVGHEG